MSDDQSGYLFDFDLPTDRFDGNTFDPEFDLDRLNKQLKRVYEVMKDERYRTLGEIADRTGDGEASISARLRDFRKPRFGSFEVQRRRRDPLKRGLYEYRLFRRRLHV